MEYRGPRAQPYPARVKLDLRADETVVRPPVLRVFHPYPDWASGRPWSTYSFEELLAEKSRALCQRARPRDLYDIVILWRSNDLRLYPDGIRFALEEKCAAKQSGDPTASAFYDTSHVADLESEWENMLGHQLPALPPLQGFLDELPTPLRLARRRVSY